MTDTMQLPPWGGDIPPLPPPPTRTDRARATVDRWLKDTTWRSFVAEGFLWLLTIGAYSVAYWSQVEVVHQHAFRRGAVVTAGVSWESLVWGASTELGALIAIFLAREAVHRGTPSWGAWIIATACTGMSLAYNLIAGGADPIGIVAHVWMPVLALGSWAWMLEGRRVKWNPRWREQFGRVAGRTKKSPPEPSPAREKTPPPPLPPVTSNGHAHPRASRSALTGTEEEKTAQQRARWADRKRRQRARQKEA